MSDTRAYYDDFSSRYDTPRGEGYHAMIDSLELEAILPLAQGKNVLEIGCGTGLLLERVADVAKSAIGIDPSPGMLEKAKARGLNVREADGVALPFADGEFEFVYSCKVLPHIGELDRALAEAARVTASGGTLLLEFYNKQSLRYAAKKLAGPSKIGAAHRESDIVTHWLSPAQIRERLPNELRIVEDFGVRIFTPAAFAVRLPVVGGMLKKAERWGLRSKLAIFGGFYLISLQKR